MGFYRYHVAKILALNEITTVKDEEVRGSDDESVKLVKYRGREYHAVVYDSGGKFR